MQLLLAYLKDKKRIIFAWVLFAVIFYTCFALYQLPLKAVIYPTFICTGFICAFFVYDFLQIKKKQQILTEAEQLSENILEILPAAENIEEKEYQHIIKLLCRQQSDTVAKMNCRYDDMVEYYTIWAHQIKTPIASMRLHLQNEDSALSRKLMSDLLRIEQYVEMVLTFLRLDSDTTDYVFKEYDLDIIVRNAVRKLRSEFIDRKLRLVYEPLQESIITDEKWLSFVIEQILSNALKYTKEGGITITLESPKTLCISDTGIGIAPEDLPGIFEKGYTGYNGRSDKRASGIGLYLCRRICSKLGHNISAASVMGEGTAIRICLKNN